MPPSKDAQIADVICLLLFAVTPSDRALAGWGIGGRASQALQSIGSAKTPFNTIAITG